MSMLLCCASVLLGAPMPGGMVNDVDAGMVNDADVVVVSLPLVLSLVALLLPLCRTARGCLPRLC